MPENEQLPPSLNQVPAPVPESANDLAPNDQAPDEQADAPQGPEEAFSWQASEYVHHHKSIMWYGVVGIAVLVLALIAAWLELWLEIGVFIAAGAAIMVYAGKPPRTLLYELSDKGVQIDEKLYPYAEFRSFGVVRDESWHSIDLEPSKRFSPRLVMLFADGDMDVILGHLERHLPREDRDPDLIERITRKVRF